MCNNRLFTLKRISITGIVIIIAIVSFRAGELYWQTRNKEMASNGKREVLYYTDPMTPGYRSKEPGIAPCGMPLEPVYADTDVNQESRANGELALSSGAVKVSPARQQLIGVSVSLIELQSMEHTLRLYGKLVTDETRTFLINASTDSWVRKLPEITTGDIVRKDQVLAEVLAPAFFNAQVTYLVALDNVDRIMQQLGGQLRHQQADLADNQIRVAVQTLQNLGITDAQIEELAQLRQAQPFLQVRSPVNGVVMTRKLTLYQWLKAGEQFFTVADLGQLWIYADVYEDEVMHLRPGMDVRVKHSQMHQNFEAKVGKVLPLFDPVAKTLKVRIDIDNPRYDLRPDMFVDVEIPITLPPTLYLPSDAVIDSGTRKIVYVETGKGLFEPRTIHTGWRLGRNIEITDGLKPGERIVVAGNFLIDSESRMRTAMVDDEGANLKHEQAYPQSESNITHPAHATLADGHKSWLEMLGKFPGSEESQDPETHPGTEGKESSVKAGTIDWSGVDKDGNKIPPREWRKGWGAFPGARYLGQQQRMEKPSDQLDQGAPQIEENQPEPEHEDVETTDDSSTPTPVRRS